MYYTCSNCIKCNKNHIICLILSYSPCFAEATRTYTIPLNIICGEDGLSGQQDLHHHVKPAWFLKHKKYAWDAHSSTGINAGTRRPWSVCCTSTTSCCTGKRISTLEDMFTILLSSLIFARQTPPPDFKKNTNLQNWKIHPCHHCPMLPLIMVLIQIFSTLSLMQCFSTHPLSLPTIFATVGAPPTQMRPLHCLELVMWGQRIASLPPWHWFGVSRQCARTSSRHVFVYFTLIVPTLKWLFIGQGGEDAHTLHSWGDWTRNCSNIHSPSHVVHWCCAQVWILQCHMGERGCLSPWQDIWLKLFGVLHVTLSLLVNQLEHTIYIVHISFAAWRLHYVCAGAYPPADCHGWGTYPRPAWEVLLWRQLHT